MITGTGVHSASTARVRLHRDDGPLRLRVSGREIPADLESVVSTDRCIVLGNGTDSVAVVEHLLAALQLSGFWSGVVIEVEGGELPILDGSAEPWLAEIAGLGEPPEPPAALSPDSPLAIESDSGRAEALPGRRRIEVTIDFPHPAIGRQHWEGDEGSWHELLDARTFGMLADVEALRASGLARGAGPENVIVYDESRPLCQLRHADEPVRHKALDLIGDMTLLGRPLAATVRVNRGSHRLHVELMQRIRQHHRNPVRAR